MTPATDRWSEWVLEKRCGGDDQAAAEGMRLLHRVRDRVLDSACVGESQTLLDVGAGDGLIAFGALDRVGASGRVIFADVSQPLLDHTRSLAEQMGVAARCTFVLAAADDLAPVADQSVHAVTTRSVLIYVRDKAAAFHEFHRVLTPGGRVSLWEPINRFNETYAPGPFWGSGVEGIEDLTQRLTDFYQALQPLAAIRCSISTSATCCAIARRRAFSISGSTWTSTSRAKNRDDGTR